MECLGKFCGRFPEEIQEIDDDEDEDDGRAKLSDRMVAKKRRKRTPKRILGKEPESKGSSGALKWTAYLSQVSVRVSERGAGPDTRKQVVRLRVVDKKDLTQSMMSSISQVARLHTIEIVNCNRLSLPPSLPMIETLVVLTMSRNHIMQFSEEVANCKTLEQLILDHNDMNDIDIQFQSMSFPSLKVLDVSHNQLTRLSDDFGKFSPARIEFIELSFNRLTQLPANIVNCKLLRELNVSNNRLTSLPVGFKLPHLQKLFASYNHLTSLPADIGECPKLVKIRLMDNKLSELPESILKLWQRRGGMLEELLVEKNPLVLPSATAFEMESEERLRIDRAFHLFEEHLENKQQSQALALLGTAGPNRAPMNPGLRLHDDDEGQMHDILAVCDSSAQSAVDSAGVPGFSYYFGHCEDENEIRNIRDSESALLLMKKNSYFQSQHRIVQKMIDEGRGDNIPPEMRVFESGEGWLAYDGKVPVRDLDLYFNLVVYSMKASYSSILVVFNKFETGQKGYLSKGEWLDLCVCCPVKLSEQMVERMWRFLAFRKPDRIELKDFIAAWHIHDLGEKMGDNDPWIERVADVLHLEYYDMNVAELQERIEGKSAPVASPVLDFDNPIDLRAFGAFSEEGPFGEAAVVLQQTAGLRRVEDPSGDVENKKAHSDEIDKKNQRLKAKLMKKISLTEDEYQKCSAIEAQENDSNASDQSVSSKDLSEEESEHSDSSDFEAAKVLAQRAVDDQSRRGGARMKRIELDSDETLRQVMDLPVDEFFRMSQTGGHTKPSAGSSAAARGKARRARARLERMNTDLVALRKSIRRVYRNMPFLDFCNLIDFLLRGMQQIHHSRNSHGTAFTYWHVDDPTFKTAMGPKGTNEYTRNLLLQMGFVKLKDYWVWPSVHLDPDKRDLDLQGRPINIWGDAFIHHLCPGKSNNRLSEMNMLLKSVQITLHKQGSDFRGHFKLER